MGDHLDELPEDELTNRKKQVQEEIQKYLTYVSKELKSILPEYKGKLEMPDERKVYQSSLNLPLSRQITALTLAMETKELEAGKKRELDVILTNLGRILELQSNLFDRSKPTKTQLQSYQICIDGYKKEKTKHRNEGLDKAENILRGFTAFLATCTVILAPVVVHKARKGTLFKRTEFEQTLERSQNIIKRKR